MTTRATIGVSCGHRVSRLPVKSGRALVYWCEACGAYRMSGGRSTGQHSNAYLHAILELVDEFGPLEFVFPDDPPPHIGKLIATLGVAIVVDPGDSRAPYVRRAA